MTPLEKVARAMADRVELLWEILPEQPDIACGHGMPEGCKAYWYTLARAALEALRNPPLSMKKAGLEITGRFGLYGTDVSGMVFTAMISQALSEED